MKHSLRMLSSEGDTRLATWETETVTPERLKEIEDEFNRKMAKGYFAANISKGEGVLIKEFDPNAEILLIPRVVGG